MTEPKQNRDRVASHGNAGPVITSSKWGLGSLAKHIPPGQLGRYLLVGIWNTAFAYGTYAGFTALLEGRVPYGYVLASVLSSLLNMTVSFLGYKWFVFKTRGNYLREWLRAVSVYGAGMLISFAALPLFVYVIRRNGGSERSAPYIAGAIVMGLNVIISFFGHKHISFRQEKPIETTSGPG